MHHAVGKDDRGIGGEGAADSTERGGEMNRDISMLPTTPTEPAPKALTPLSSGYQEAEHGAYARYLTAGLQQPKVLNIALTGGYGSGKSSVIEHIENSKKFKVLNVAISSLGNDLGEPGTATKGAGAGADLTNRIEKAIVKQLLYRESPEKLPCLGLLPALEVPAWAGDADVGGSGRRRRSGTSAPGVEP